MLPNVAKRTGLSVITFLGELVILDVDGMVVPQSRATATGKMFAGEETPLISQADVSAK